jgi:hypothetical protein
VFREKKRSYPVGAVVLSSGDQIARITLVLDHFISAAIIVSVADNKACLSTEVDL